MGRRWSGSEEDEAQRGTEPQEQEPTVYICGGCGRASLESFPPCVAGEVPHQDPPEMDYPHPDWVLQNLRRNPNHPVHGPHALKYA